MSKIKNSFKYTELTKNAKKTAMQEYLDGWREEHDDLDIEEVHSLLIDTNDEYFYDKNGHIID